MDIYPAGAELIRGVPIDRPFSDICEGAAKRSKRQLYGHSPNGKLDPAKPGSIPARLHAVFDAGTTSGSGVCTNPTEKASFAH